ncbi:MAG TPA: cell wall biosynthesis glycosyltransferase [Vicinamibacterales bacterium]|nr:cell wall biosynthesis glycosyltransferase [Vicinamibacterales bacterium]
MSAPDILAPAVRGRLDQIGRADIVVGIPSYQSAATIGHVVQAAQTGLAKYFPSAQSVILNADGGSTDGTPAVVESTSGPDTVLVMVSQPERPIQRFTIPYHGLPGKGSAFRTIFAAAEALGATACAVVDSDLRSITPEWIHLLLAPILDRTHDYVAPYYLRHKFDGTITNNVVYPLTRALYGKRIRQPIGGEFGMSLPLIRHYLRQSVWETDVARFGIDIWMTTEAVCGDFRVCQAFLGAKIHNAKDPGADLSAMLVQVLGTVFRLMEAHEARWQPVRATEAVPVFGFQYGVGLEPVHVDVGRMIDHFRRGVRDLAEIWGSMFGRDDMARLRTAAASGGDSLAIGDDLWVRLIYDLAAAYRRRASDRDALVRATLPLYMGRVASFVLEMAGADAAEVEARLERLCSAFEAQKDYLRRRWDAAHGPPSRRGRTRRIA